MSPGYPLDGDLQVNTKTSQFPFFQWDDETDMAKMEECVRSIHMDGLVWGASKLVPVGYGIKKLQIQCVVEDEKVGTDILEEEITKFEDYVSLGMGMWEGPGTHGMGGLTQVCFPGNTWMTPAFVPFQVQSVDIAAFNKI